MIKLFSINNIATIMACNKINGHSFKKMYVDFNKYESQLYNYLKCYFEYGNSIYYI